MTTLQFRDEIHSFPDISKGHLDANHTRVVDIQAIHSVWMGVDDGMPITSDRMLIGYDWM
jgi:hypothetical protein